MRMCKSWQVLLLASVTVSHIPLLSVTLGPVAPFALPYALLAELVYTFVPFVVLNTAASKRNISPDAPTNSSPWPSILCYSRHGAPVLRS